jgi:hypothetical protein
MPVEPDQLRSCSLFTGLGHEELEPLCDWFKVAILGDGRRSATVTTTSPATLLVMFGTEFRGCRKRSRRSRRGSTRRWPTAPSGHR